MPVQILNLASYVDRSAIPCEVLSSKDGSVKVVQSVWEKAQRVNVETGRYLTDDGDKVCLSSQVGCAMRCSFCVTGQEFEYAKGVPKRLLRSLRTQEIVDQALNALEILPARHPDLTFAFMGMGEPFANKGAVLAAVIELGRRFPQSRVTLSTIGHDLEGIKALAQDIAAGHYPVPIRLHISVHGARDEQRKEIVPAAKPLVATLDAAAYYAELTKTTVKLNYVLVDGANDSVEDAREIVRLLASRPGLMLKLSSLNKASGHLPPPDEQHRAFVKALEAGGVLWESFRSMGIDIEAGCGQLAKGRSPETILAVVKQRSGKTLVLLRADGTRYGGCWSVVSGKLEHGETALDGLARELKEEIGLDLRSGAVLASSLPTFTYRSESDPLHRFVVHPFLVELTEPVAIQIQPHEHSDWQWIDSEEIKSLKTAGPLLEELQFIAAHAHDAAPARLEGGMPQ